MRAKNFYASQGFALKQTLEIRYNDEVVQMAVMVRAAQTRGGVQDAGSSKEDDVDEETATAIPPAARPVFKEPQ